MDADPLLSGPSRSGQTYEATPSRDLDSVTPSERRTKVKAEHSTQQQTSRSGSQDDEESECHQLLSSGGDQKYFTIQESIDNSGLGWFQVKLTVVLGLTWMADSMEIMLLSILGPVLSCNWYLPSWQQALLSTLVMTGMMLGSTYWGTITDKYGRKTSLTLATALIGYFGFLSSFCPMYTWMAIIRFLVGCCLAAVPQTAVLYSEYLPTNYRSAGLLFLAVFWAVGAAVQVLLAMAVMPSLGWRYLMALSAVPVLLFPTFSHWMPESARYYITCGCHKEAHRMLQMVAKENNKSMLAGKLATVDSELVARGQVKDMFTSSFRVLSCVLNGLWFLYGLLYYGLALLLPTLLNKPDGCHGYDIEEKDRESCIVACRAFSQKDYVDLVASAFADMPGLVVAYLLLRVMGRRASMALSSLFCGIFLLVSNICMGRMHLTATLFIARAMIAGGYQVLFIYTTECYPTNIRAIGLGVTAGAAKVGALLTPFIAQVLTNDSAFASFTTYGVAALWSSVLALLLPFDTRGRAMMDVSH
ncbi:hypothetical protein RRG08_045067 [Elysia crispata]|uniref:Major facilitator superfamily (MFS) profile domain-containing protein n=1 Tax=Elysia crispata TaxID=231223 RepID=A0AAE0YH54_9GAST|nr:hypothetical protein RRG08_045067 [Elysia crispata]